MDSRIGRSTDHAPLDPLHFQPRDFIALPASHHIFKRVTVTAICGT
jgi:hypothetical protein